MAKFLVDDCTVVSNSSSEKLDFRVLVYSNIFSDIELGDNIVFSGKLNKFETDDDMSKLSQNIGYSVFVNNEDIVVTEGEMSIKDIIKDKVRKVYEDNLNYDNMNISYAIMFGDKNGMSDNISEMFSYAGISHILAVSGLHVGVLVGLLWFILRKIKVNKYVRWIILSLLLLDFSYHSKYH